MSIAWLLRGLTGMGGVIVLLLGVPVAEGALQAQRADAVVTKLRLSRPLSVPEVRAALAAFDKAVAADPVAIRYFQRSELLAGAALAMPADRLDEAERTEWFKRAKVDLDRALANDPSRALEWLRLAAVRKALDGASRDLVPPIFMSLEVGRNMSTVWEGRLRLILDNWGFFTDEEKARLNDYVVMTWNRTIPPERFWWGREIRDVFDEVIVRYLLRDVPNAQEELTKWIKQDRRL